MSKKKQLVYPEVLVRLSCSAIRRVEQKMIKFHLLIKNQLIFRDIVSSSLEVKLLLSMIVKIGSSSSVYLVQGPDNIFRTL